MRNPHGHIHWFGGEGPDVERDTFTCSHCNAVVIVKPAAPVTESGGWCLHCSRAVCEPCQTLGRCTPFEKRLENYERRQASLSWLG